MFSGLNIDNFLAKDFNAYDFVKIFSTDRLIKVTLGIWDKIKTSFNYRGGLLFNIYK